MGNRIAASIAVLLILVFLGYYAIILRSVPLWIIIVAVLAMVLTDYYQSAIKGNNNMAGNNNSKES